MVTVRKHSARRYHAPPSNRPTRNPFGRRNKLRLAKGQPPVHVHSNVRLLSYDQSAPSSGRRVDARKGALSLLGLLKRHVSKGLAAAGRTGEPVSDDVKSAQRSLAALAGAFIATLPEKERLPVGLFLKRRVLDVSMPSLGATPRAAPMPPQDVLNEVAQGYTLESDLVGELQRVFETL
jgi:hypothetical protein